MQRGCMLRNDGLTPAPSRDFVPAADLLFAPPKSRQKALPCKTAPAGSPAMLETRGSRGTHFATLRSDNRAKSVDEACFARASGFCASRRFRRGGPKQPNTTAKPESRSHRGIPLTPFSPAEQQKALKPRAKRASRTDSARLFDRSAAKGVPRGASRPEQRREPEAQRRAGRSGGALWLLSGGPENRRFRRSQSDSTAGAKSPHGPRQNASAARSAKVPRP
jgi:hypothetical protein